MQQQQMHQHAEAGESVGDAAGSVLGTAVPAGIAVALGLTLFVDALADASGYHPAEHSPLLRLVDWATHSSAWQAAPMLLALATAALLLRTERAPRPGPVRSLRRGPAGPLAAVLVASAAGWSDGVPGARLPAPLLVALALLACVGPYRERWALGALAVGGLAGVVPVPVAAAVVACAAVRTAARIAPDPRQTPLPALFGTALVAAALVV